MGDGSGISVRGGWDGIDAQLEDLVSLARLYGHAATDTGGSALSLHRHLADPGLVGAAALDPGGALAYEAALLDALDGVHGLTVLALRCADMDAALRGAAVTYGAADRIAARVEPAVHGLVAMPHAALTGGRTFLHTRSAYDAVDAALTADPEVADIAVNALGGVRGPLARHADALLVDGHPAVRSRGVDAQAGGPPRNVADLMRSLSRRSGGRHGEIGVQRLANAGGSPSWVVDIPGTKSWSALPNHDVTSLATNVHAAGGAPTSYERGVLQAMREAGIGRDDPVLLVGHSEGGMIAVNAASRGQFNVTHVITAGSPVGRTSGRVPPGVQVLAIENEGDLVPHLDGASNPARPNVLTVHVRHDQSEIASNHDIDSSYVPGAADIDASTNPSVLHYRAGLTRYFSATSAQTSSYVVVRGF